MKHFLSVLGLGLFYGTIVLFLNGTPSEAFLGVIGGMLMVEIHKLPEGEKKEKDRECER